MMGLLIYLPCDNEPNHVKEIWDPNLDSSKVITGRPEEKKARGEDDESYLQRKTDRLHH